LPTIVFGQETFGWSWNRTLRTEYPAYPHEIHVSGSEYSSSLLKNPKNWALVRSRVRLLG
jgi:hypothetical protein